MEQSKKTGFFEVSPGNFSIMRLAFAWLLANGTAMAWFVLVAQKDPTGAGMIFGAFASVATGLKVIQKHQEKKEQF